MSAIDPEARITARQHVEEGKRYVRVAKRAESTSRFMRVVLWITLVGGSIAFAMPLYIMVVMALKSPGEIATTAAWSWPKELTWDNFHTVLTNENAPFPTFFKNSFVIAFFSTLGVVLSSALVAYPFARLKFRGRDRLFILLLSTMMLPGVVTMIPSYIMFAQIKWVDTFLPLTVPAFFGGGAFNIFLLRQFYMGIPRDLDEAAILDGASFWVIFWRVIFPNSGAALATVGVFSFIYSWKDFMGPLLYLNDPQKQTLESGLRMYQTLQQEAWHYLMAGSFLVILPLLVMFLIGQRYFVKGIVMSGIK